MNSTLIESSLQYLTSPLNEDRTEDAFLPIIKNLNDCRVLLKRALQKVKAYSKDPDWESSMEAALMEINDAVRALQIDLNSI